MKSFETVVVRDGFAEEGVGAYCKYGCSLLDQ